jgi:membrane protease YdiL (CAAX protease family)
MKTGTASGLQVAFFTFAVLLLAVPITGWLSGGLQDPSEERVLLGKGLPILLAAGILFGFPKLRRQCRECLEQPIPADARLEVAIVTCARLLLPFALIGAFSLWHWSNGAELGLARYIRAWRSEDAEMARAFVPAHLIFTFLGAGLLAPIFEELVFRGLLYRAWERQIGWFSSMILVSVLFGLYHREFWSSFTSSIVFVCLYRRAGSLWAPIIAHSAANISLWYPLLGRHVVPRNLSATGDILQLAPQLSLLLVLAFALPAYVWMARRGRAQSERTASTAPHGAVPQ